MVEKTETVQELETYRDSAGAEEKDILVKIDYGSLKQIHNELPDGDLPDLEAVISAEEVMKYNVDYLKNHLEDKIWEAHRVKVYKKNFCLIAADNDSVRFSQSQPLSSMIAVYKRYIYPHPQQIELLVKLTLAENHQDSEGFVVL